jgi:hypothetical protein
MGTGPADQPMIRDGRKSGICRSGAASQRPRPPPPPAVEPCPTEEDPDEAAAVDPLLMDGAEAAGAAATVPEYPPDVGAMVGYIGPPPKPPMPRLLTGGGTYKARATFCGLQ